ncbi:LOW QUALITY PROTEIN: hypothetical protein T552_04083 [Pneumocystis carinii B80]|uniref:Uncharacterized protein n=1 Tax=Pneumocystis carinii (strain B80) TaxID=1408658 RepID=A0A0W4ZPF8_PNEC8|nr:LOW QUALITY PROTEIN: hypothetical protein T552_04083 [Pneumocystis carinii B80]KTW30276.1 LOW QUALITY PROTEIN: hypothetical protein T552_04083 [Pneumocystis carinii B80]
MISRCRDIQKIQSPNFVFEYISKKLSDLLSVYMFIKSKIHMPIENVDLTLFLKTISKYIKIFIFLLRIIRIFKVS